jgi:hypothetical protein
VVLDSVLIDPERISESVSCQVFQNILGVLPDTYPLKTVAHDGETFGLVYSHTFFKVSQ